MDDFSKYKQFRNFMCNELGITRQDIEAWTKQSVANEVEKRLNSINIDKMVTDTIQRVVANSMNGYSSGGLRDAIAQQIAKRLKVIASD